MQVRASSESQSLDRVVVAGICIRHCQRALTGPEVQSTPAMTTLDDFAPSSMRRYSFRPRRRMIAMPPRVSNPSVVGSGTITSLAAST